MGGSSSHSIWCCEARQCHGRLRPVGTKHKGESRSLPPPAIFSLYEFLCMLASQQNKAPPIYVYIIGGDPWCSGYVTGLLTQGSAVRDRPIALKEGF